MTKLTSIRSNSQPAGGPTATTGTPPTLTPADIAALVQQLKPTIEAFRDASTPQSIQLPATALGLGVGAPTRIASVGLGYLAVTTHTVVIAVNFSAAGSVQVDPWFPFSAISNIACNINGGTTVFSTDGPGSLLSYARNRRGMFTPYYGVSSAGSLPPSLCSVTVAGAGITTTAATAYSASGIKTITAAAAGTATITAVFTSFAKLAYSRDSLLGALPLQNNSVFATLTHQPVGVLLSAAGNPKAAPLYTAVAATAALTSWNAQTEYDFWAVPSDPALYADMVSNSYQVLQQPGVTAAATGLLAWSYPLPQNQFAVATHLVGFDGNGNYLVNSPAASALSRLVLNYNGGGVTPVSMQRAQTLAKQYADYGSDLSTIPGYYLWDGDATAESLTDTDSAGWLNAYSAASPQLQGDVAAATATPISVNVTREIVIAGAVQTVGG